MSRTYAIVTAAVAPASLRAIAADPAVRYVTEVLAPQVGSVAAPRAVPGVTHVGVRADRLGRRQPHERRDRARSVNGIDGTGETIGILSDSFDTAPGAVTHAADDVAAGELPGPGNPCGYTTPVTVQSDFAGGGQVDEGRAMAQLAHGLAPGARLAFATADNGELDLVNQIDRLRTVNHAQRSRRRRDVPRRAVLPGRADRQRGRTRRPPRECRTSRPPGNTNVIVGGNNVSSYEAPAFRPTPCPVLDESAMSCHNFDPTGGTSSSDEITLAAGGGFGLDLQWAQPWGAVTTDLDAFVISASGSILAESEVKNSESGTPFEFLDYGNATGSPQTVRIVIAKYAGDDEPASEVRDARRIRDHGGAVRLVGRRRHRRAVDLRSQRHRRGREHRRGPVQQLADVGEFLRPRSGDAVLPADAEHRAARRARRCSTSPTSPRPTACGRASSCNRSAERGASTERRPRRRKPPRSARSSSTRIRCSARRR